MPEDAPLLRQFVVDRSEAAFAELVSRHLALVYHAAARQLGDDAHLAGDVAQRVFLLLAEKSSGLLDHPSLAGWLHTTTHFEVAGMLRAERRRRAREDAAHSMNDLMNQATDASDAEWARLRPVIDAALQELSPEDREAVLLRFFENRPFAEIGLQLRLNEKTAHKRVERALDKLRGRLARRGVTSTAAALAAALGGQSALAAPAGLAASVTGSVVASGFPMAAAVGTGFFMSTKTTAMAAALAVFLASGVTIYEVKARSAEDMALATMVAENNQLAAQLRSEQERATKMAARAPAPVAAPAARPAPAAEDKPILAGPTMADRDAEGTAFLAANPAFREAFVARQRANVREGDAELIARLGLTGEQLERYITVRINGTRSAVGEHVFTLADWNTQTAGEYARQLREVLGEEGHRQFREMQSLTPATSLADALVRALYFTPTPPTAAQIEEMKRLVLQVTSDPANGLRYTSAWSNMPLPMWDALLARAGGVLTESQLEALRDLHQRAKYEDAHSKARQLYRQQLEKSTP